MDIDQRKQEIRDKTEKRKPNFKERRKRERERQKLCANCNEKTEKTITNGKLPGQKDRQNATTNILCLLGSSDDSSVAGEDKKRNWTGLLEDVVMNHFGTTTQKPSDLESRNHKKRPPLSFSTVM